MTLVDREEGAAEAFAAEGIELHPLFRKSEFASEGNVSISGPGLWTLRANPAS